MVVNGFNIIASGVPAPLVLTQTSIVKLVPKMSRLVPVRGTEIQSLVAKEVAVPICPVAGVGISPQPFLLHPGRG